MQNSPILVLYKRGNLGPGYSAKCSSWSSCRTLTSVHEPIQVYEENKLHQDSLASIHWPQRRGFKGFGGFVNQANWSCPKTLFLLKTGTLRCFFFVRGLTTSKLMDLDILLVPFLSTLCTDMTPEIFRRPGFAFAATQRTCKVSVGRVVPEALLFVRRHCKPQAMQRPMRNTCDQNKGEITPSLVNVTTYNSERIYNCLK